MRGRSIRRGSSSEDDDADSGGESPERRLGITWESAVAGFERTFRVRITFPRNSKAGKLARNKYFVLLFVVTVVLLLFIASSAIFQFFQILSARHGVSHRSKISPAARHPPPPGSMPTPRSRSAVEPVYQKRNSTGAADQPQPRSKTILIRRKGRLVRHSVPLKGKGQVQLEESMMRPSREWFDSLDLPYKEQTLSDFDRCVTNLLEWKNADEFEYAVSKRVANILRRAGRFKQGSEPMAEAGTFLDIGAFDGWRRSVTYVMELCAGWRGACVEPNPEMRDFLRSNRPLCKHIPAAIHHRRANNDKCRYLQVTTIGFQHLSSLADMIEDKALLIQNEEYSKGHHDFRRTIEVPCLTLNTLHTPVLNEGKKANETIPQPSTVTRDPFNRVVYDLVSIHTVGGEEDILRSIDWNMFVAHVIVVHNPHLDRRIQSFLEHQGYSLRFKWSTEGKFHTLLFEVYVSDRFAEIYQDKEFWEHDEFSA